MVSWIAPRSPFLEVSSQLIQVHQKHYEQYDNIQELKMSQHHNNSKNYELSPHLLSLLEQPIFVQFRQCSSLDDIDMLYCDFDLEQIVFHNNDRWDSFFATTKKVTTVQKSCSFQSNMNGREIYRRNILQGFQSSKVYPTSTFIFVLYFFYF
jgi:hypothetical protein